jgi:hypothetical protein
LNRLVLTVYKDLGRTMPVALLKLRFPRVPCRLSSPSNGLQNIALKAEVVELADTPSDTVYFSHSLQTSDPAAFTFGRSYFRRAAQRRPVARSTRRMQAVGAKSAAVPSSLNSLRLVMN